MYIHLELFNFSWSIIGKNWECLHTLRGIRAHAVSQRCYPLHCQGGEVCPLEFFGFLRWFLVFLLLTVSSFWMIPWMELKNLARMGTEDVYSGITWNCDQNLHNMGARGKNDWVIICYFLEYLPLVTLP